MEQKVSEFFSASYRLAKSSLTSLRLAWLMPLIPWILIAAFSYAYIVMSVHNYIHLESGVDLAGYAQALHHLSQGEMPYNSFKEQIMWGDHAHFIITLLAPIYHFIPDARLLLVVQVLAVTLAGWPLYQLAYAYTKNGIFSFSLLYAYLGFIGTQYALDFDFHPSVLTGAAIIWFMYAHHFKKWWLFWIAFIVGLTTREDAPPIFFMIGAYFLFKKQWRLALATMSLSAIYFLITVYWLMPQWTPDHAALLYLDSENKSAVAIISSFFKHPKAILQNTFDQPAKLNTMNVLFSSFGYLPLLSPFTYLSAAPIFYSRFTSSQDYRWQINNHSNANIVPILALGALFAVGLLLTLLDKIKLKFLKPWLLATLSVWLIISVQINAWNDQQNPLYTTLIELYSNSKSLKSPSKDFKSLLKIIPEDAEISAPSGLLAYLANRNRLLNYPASTNQTSWIILSSTANPWPIKKPTMIADIRKFIKDPDWELVWSRNEIYAFRKKVEKPTPSP